MSELAAFPEEERGEVEIVGLDPHRYAVVRRIGATHAEVMEAFVLGTDLTTYALFRSEHPHRRALDEAGAPNSPTHLEAGRLGVTDAELAEVRASHRASVDAYWRSLAADGPPPVHDLPVTRVGDYLTARRAGLGHADALTFAMRVAALTHRPGTRDLTLWARCRAAGLPNEMLFSHPPRSTPVALAGMQLEVLHALLFASRSFEEAPVTVEEMLWVAARSATRRLDVRILLTARAAGRSRRRALRAARRGSAAARQGDVSPTVEPRRGRRSRS